MKFLKKASLAVSIAAVSFAANAELVAMDEASMAAATGQAGIDLDVTLTGANAITIGEVVYTDTDSDGSLALMNIAIGTDAGSITLNHTIDIDSSGNLQIAQSAYTSDLKISVGQIETRDNTGAAAANLIKGTYDATTGALVEAGLTLTMDVAPSQTTIGANADGDTQIAMQGAFKVTGGNANLLNGAIGVGSITFTGDYTATDVNGVVLGENLVQTDIVMTANTSGLAVTVNSLQGTLNLGDVSMGGAIVGDIAVKDIALAGASILISGH
ncbi:MAG: DUF6160 family protein [Thalassolituus sp.]